MLTIRKTTAPDANLIELLHKRRAPTPNMKLKSGLQSGIMRYPREGVSAVPMTLADGTMVYVRTSPIESVSASDDNDRALSCSCLLYTSPSPRDRQKSRMPSSA